jgi:F0F1-type ATP synthase epsilon subunit
MPHHGERAPSVLAHGSAKSDDIEAARRGTAEARASEHSHAQDAIGEIETACRTMREELAELERIVATQRS